MQYCINDNPAYACTAIVHATHHAILGMRSNTKPHATIVPLVEPFGVKCSPNGGNHVPDASARRVLAQIARPCTGEPGQWATETRTRERAHALHAGASAHPPTMHGPFPTTTPVRPSSESNATPTTLNGSRSRLPAHRPARPRAPQHTPRLTAPTRRPATAHQHRLPTDARRPPSPR